MSSNTLSFDVRVNNVRATVRPNTPEVTAERILSETHFHPQSYALFTDEFGSLEEGPGSFDDRRGDWIPRGERVSLREYTSFVAILERELELASDSKDDDSEPADEPDR
jgi:hypothetical protein